jgi:hypothetical protein
MESKDLTLTVLVSQVESTGFPRYDVMGDSVDNYESLLNEGLIYGVPALPLSEMRSLLSTLGPSHKMIVRVGLSAAEKHPDQVVIMDDGEWLLGYLPTPAGLLYVFHLYPDQERAISKLGDELRSSFLGQLGIDG